ncbi:kinase-like protein [Serendipita vermifera]|nr:kinase-like protein [Serendipita vermifera]
MSWLGSLVAMQPLRGKLREELQLPQEQPPQDQNDILQADVLPQMVISPSNSSLFELSGLVHKLEKRPLFDGYIHVYMLVNIAVRRELQTWWKLRHPNILPLLGYIHEDDANELYRALVFPWMENGSAAQYIKRDLTPAQRLSLFGDIINGLQYLHNFQPVVVHADLKPSNILITEDGIGQICDFGLVRLLQDMHTSTTTTTAYIGTTRYLAYELIPNMGDALPTTATDIYTLGCLGMEFIYRRAPHHDLGDNTFKIMQRISGGHYPAELPTDTTGELTPLGSLFINCWAISPTQRPNINDIHTWFWDNHGNILAGL